MISLAISSQKVTSWVMKFANVKSGDIFNRENILQEELHDFYAIVTDMG